MASDERCSVDDVLIWKDAGSIMPRMGRILLQRIDYHDGCTETFDRPKKTST